jgi:hypothetical protein
LTINICINRKKAFFFRKKYIPVELILGNSRNDQGLEGFIKQTALSQASVARACSPSYSEGKDQEDRSSKPA